ncbi:hypothetical protein PCIT_a1426 [Pseudoalteromonas citrea]|uniref:Uncharacterized protein n=1 Tax=Pseudoalteromonas citrea TaxID=43655 RepID=A0AAD4AMB8_9GAMM|nr:hypothetical protein PCIT_a1426 [Pseudoalteromonas citrea]
MYKSRTLCMHRLKLRCIKYTNSAEQGKDSFEVIGSTS